MKKFVTKLFLFVRHVITTAPRDNPPCIPTSPSKDKILENQEENA
jgi:hypothetical protein